MILTIRSARNNTTIVKIPIIVPNIRESCNNPSQSVGAANQIAINSKDGEYCWKIRREIPMNIIDSAQINGIVA